MAGKISEYPAKTVFNDDDLYDVSTKDGVNYISQRSTFLALKDAIVSDLIPLEITKSTFDLSNLGSVTNTTGSFVGTTNLSGNFGYHKVGKVINLFWHGDINFPAGGTGGRFQIRFPIELPTWIDLDLGSVSVNGSASAALFNYQSLGGGTGENFQSAHASVRYDEAAPNFRELMVNVVDLNPLVDTIIFNAQATIPVV